MRLTRSRVPHVHTTVRISVDDQTTIGAQCDTARLTRIVPLVDQWHAPGDIPNSDRSICAAGRQNLTVAAERNSAHAANVALKRAD
jgi:hypothetical protein